MVSDARNSAPEKNREGRLKTRGEGNFNAKLTEEKVKKIRLLRQAGHDYNDIMNQFGISRTQVWRVIHKKDWAWVE